MALLFTILVILIPIFILLSRRRRRFPSKKIPPGSLGFPIIGQTLSFLRAVRADALGPWLEDRVKRYGAVSKLCLLGKPTVFIYGPAANKFLGGNILGTQRLASVTKLLGDRNILQLSGEDHKRMRDALMMFLKPESLKLYVEKMDEEVKRHLQMHWEGNKRVMVLHSMKTMHMQFSIICSLLFGVESGRRRVELSTLCGRLMDGLLSVPINLPFTTYNRSISASKRIRGILMELIHEKRVALEEKGNLPQQDLITCLLSIRGKHNEQAISDDEIVDNALLVMIAGHDTSSALITFIIRCLASDSIVLPGVLQEQEDIAKNKSLGESLTWEDVSKMKYTWKVALEILRMFPPVFGIFRKTLADVEYDGYIIPEGWQILWVTRMTHMDANIFEEPTKFDPARFDNQADIPPYSFIPFGVGPRMCPGNEFARIETLVAIHYLVTRFTWKSCCKDDSITWGPFPIPSEGLPMEITPRL